MRRHRLAVVLLASVAAIGVGCGDTGAGDDVAEPDAGPPDAGCGASAPDEDGVVVTTAGAVRGARDGATWAYRGIPYAAPPTGDRRFREPAPPACWDGVRDASAFGAQCPQLAGDAYAGDEDCLTLNVWVPDGGAPAKPVMVWIHGGGNAIGSSSFPVYDGDRLAAAGDVIVVTINYRLAQLGWLAHPALSAERTTAVSGNWGLLDQVAALAWVEANAAAFGGDPGNVTIFGESAGGRNVCTLLATPAAAARFDRAIVQSGACRFLRSHAEAEARGGDVAAAVGCDGAADVAACLRGVSAEALIRALPSDVGALGSSQDGPVIDGVVLPEMPEEAILAGRHHDVPLIVGANADETSAETPLGMTAEQYEARVRAMFGPLADAVLAEYAGVSPPRAAFVKLTSDSRFICPSREIARSAAAGGASPARRYFLSYAPGVYGAVHGLDVVYLFGTFESVLVDGVPYQPTSTDLALRDAFQRHWTRFARTGSPGGGADPAWTPVADAATDDPALVLDAPLAVTDGAGTEHCDFWAPLYHAL